MPILQPSRGLRHTIHEQTKRPAAEAVLREKAAIHARLCAEAAALAIKYTRPDGPEQGMSPWVELPEPMPAPSSQYEQQQTIFALRAIGEPGVPKYTEILARVSEPVDGHPDATGQETVARLGADVFFTGSHGTSLTAPGVTTRTTTEYIGQPRTVAATPAEFADVNETLMALERAFEQLPQPAPTN